ncbi:ArdC family protein [Bacillus sp. JR_15]
MAYSKDNYKQKKIDSIIEDLNNKLEEFRNNDETYKQFLDTTSKFHNYSINNVLLIASQRPDATAVAGYKSWKNKFDRQVQKGAKGINIIAPVVKKKDVEIKDNDGNVIRDINGNPKTERKPVISGYRAHNVFDVADTKGKPLITAKDLIKSEFENSDDYKNLYNEFKDYLNEKTDISVEEKYFLDDPALSEGAHGYFSHTNNNIVISDDKSYDMKFKTLIHEYAHSQLHDPENEQSKSLKELEAESSAYIVANYYGLDTSDFSLGYISGWANDLSDEQIKDHVKSVHEFSQNTIEEINSLPEFSRYIDNTLQSKMNNDLYSDINNMIDRNLKNGFDKVTIIQGNLENKFNLEKTDENVYENENFKITFDYNGYDTNNVEDTCKINLKNKMDNSLDKEFNYTQTYNRNEINHTSTIFVRDNNATDDKVYKHNRDLDGSINQSDEKLSHSDEIVQFEKFVNSSVEDKGILNTMAQFIQNGYDMGYDLNLNDNENTNETYINMSKTEKNGFKSVLSSKIEHDQNENIYVDFKIKNPAGIKNLNFTESSEEFNKQNLETNQTQEKQEEMDM